MERNAMQSLINWKNKKNRKPLLLYGARQVGKTYLVKEFGNRYFKDIIYVNLRLIILLVILLMKILNQIILLKI